MLTFKSPYSTSPSDVQDGDKFVFIVVGSAGHAEDWAAYRLALGLGQGELNELSLAEALQYATEQGDKIPEEIAKGLFFALAQSGRYYRD